MKHIATVLSLLLLSCGSAPSPAPVGPTMLAWIQHPTWNDNSPLDPRRDLSYFEVYVSPDNEFTDNELVAVLAAVDNAGVMTESFDLALLAAYGIRPGQEGCLAGVRSISSHNVPSRYGTCWWEGR